MRRILAYTLSVALLASCSYLPKPQSHRTSYEISSMAEDLCSIPTSYAVLALSQALLVDDFIGEDDSGKNQEKYSSISYNYYYGTYSIDGIGYLVTDGQSIRQEGTEWQVNICSPYSDNEVILSYGLTCIEGGWKMTNNCPNSDNYGYFTLYDVSLLEFESILFPDEKDGYPQLCVTFTGKYEELQNNFRAEFSSGEKAIYTSFGKSFSLQSNSDYEISFSVNMKGNASVNYYQEDRLLDWCKIRWDVNKTTFQTSLDR
ncbi:MAG: hypothetical protein KBT00_06955 [Bacteroidales bacterium]|nr:hypothetical protein [Candidatus Cacconaster merdequi]